MVLKIDPSRMSAGRPSTPIVMAGRPVEGRLAVAFLLLASLVLVGCGGAALDLGGEAASASPLTPATSPPSATDPPGSDPPGSDPPGTDGPTDPPPGQLPTPEPTPTSAAQTEPPDDQDDMSLAGTWVGTIETNGNTQEIRFVLRDLRSRGGEISGTALWESGKVDNGLRGTLEGDLLMLDDLLVNGINVYEGTVNGDVFTGTWTTVPRLEGQSPGTFEVTREE